MRSPEGCIGGGVIRVEIDRALKEVGRLVVLFTARVRQKFATTQHIFVRSEIFGGLGEDTLPFETSERYRRRADDTAGNVVLHGKDVLGLGIVGIGPDMNPRRGLGQFDIDPDTIAGSLDAALEQITSIQEPADLGRGGVRAL